MHIGKAGWNVFFQKSRAAANSVFESFAAVVEYPVVPDGIPARMVRLPWARAKASYLRGGVSRS